MIPPKVITVSWSQKENCILLAEIEDKQEQLELR
jgi:hypothetical protein